MYAIDTEGLGRRFGERWAVRDLNLQVHRGEVFGLLGPNGAGKTTIMRMLACLISPSAGRASVCGFDVAQEASRVRERVGILTESPGLYDNRTAMQNLEFYAELFLMDRARARAKIEYWLTALDLWDRRDDRAGNFSKGMKQKLSMARALLHEPELVVLDEPTSALDAEGAKLVRDCIAGLKGEGRTIILCTHNLFEAQSLCDRVGIVKETLLRVDTPEQLQRSLYTRQVEVRLRPAGLTDALMGHLVTVVAALDGVGGAAFEDDRLLISVVDPDTVTPEIVTALAAAGARILRVAEVEHSLEKAYLELISRHRQPALDADLDRVALP